MSLDTGALIDHTFANVAKAEDFAFAAWSGAVTVALSVGHFGDGKLNMKQVREGLAYEANLIGINVNTWQSYVGSMFKAADKLAKMAETLPDFQSLPDQDTVGACTLVEMWLRSLNMETGGHIRDWTKQDGLEAFNPNAARDARIAKAAVGQAGSAGLLRANRGDAKTATISDMATAAPVDAMASLIASIGAISNMADALAALAAVNAKVAELQAMEAKLPAPTLAPVTADDAAAPHPLSSLGRVIAKRAA